MRTWTALATAAAPAVAAAALLAVPPGPASAAGPSSLAASPSPSRTMMSDPVIGPCKITYAVVSQWPGGFQGEVRVANIGTMPITGWSLRWSYADGQVLGQAWGATYTQAGAAVTATNASYTASIPPGGSVSFGFLSAWTGANATPTSFALNGQVCA